MVTAPGSNGGPGPSANVGIGTLPTLAFMVRELGECLLGYSFGRATGHRDAVHEDYGSTVS